jgi:hypothetical protein
VTEPQTNAKNDSLFEMPRGIRVVPEEQPPADPAETTIMLPGDLEGSEQLLRGFDPEAEIRNTKLGQARVPVAKPTVKTLVVARGSHFIYALVLFALNLGVLGLALTWQDSRLLAICLVATPITTVWFWLRLRAWMNRTPYLYRLLTSLGEDAENLLHMRIWRWLRMTIRSLYS